MKDCTHTQKNAPEEGNRNELLTVPSPPKMPRNMIENFSQDNQKLHKIIIKFMRIRYNLWNLRSTKKMLRKLKTAREK